ncbi:ferritin-like protein [Streptomyces shenzhenensis]|uniref:ferritin-like protein n=1 Tax=Streptomyces shenzhenensis TaxID=943815 RepID=UPI00217DEFE6|nr:ferritin-like protein [Streptomyces shenzhenensis]
MFLRLEQPALPGAPAEGDHYETIGQFYDAIEQGLRHLCAELGEPEVFCGDPARQVTAGPFAHTGGQLTAVTDLGSALAALEEIVEQGEGTARGAVWDGDRLAGIHPMRPDPRRADHPLGMEMPDGDGTTAGPTFEYAEPGRRR